MQLCVIIVDLRAKNRGLSSKVSALKIWHFIKLENTNISSTFCKNIHVIFFDSWDYKHLGSYLKLFYHIKSYLEQCLGKYHELTGSLSPI